VNVNNNYLSSGCLSFIININIAVTYLRYVQFRFSAPQRSFHLSSSRTRTRTSPDIKCADQEEEDLLQPKHPVPVIRHAPIATTIGSIFASYTVDILCNTLLTATQSGSLRRPLWNAGRLVYPPWLGSSLHRPSSLRISYSDCFDLSRSMACC